MFLKIPQILDGDGLARAPALLDQAPWQDGRTTAGSQAAAVKMNEQVAADSRRSGELQSSLVQVRQQHGEDAALVQLTGTYHNLLRLWADT